MEQHAVRVSVEVEGAAQAMRRLEQIARRAALPEPAMQDILAEMRRMVSRQFASGGSYRGPAWQHLKPQTIKRKHASPDPRVKANAERILLATGAMRRSLTDARSRDGASRATKDEIILASRLKRARAHHRGAPSRHLPSRPLIRLTTVDERRFATIILRHLTSRD